MLFLRNLISDLATLRRPVTAAAVVAFGLALAAPFGLDPEDVPAEQLTGALAAIGVVFAYIESRV